MVSFIDDYGGEMIWQESCESIAPAQGLDTGNNEITGETGIIASLLFIRHESDGSGDLVTRLIQQFVAMRENKNPSCIDSSGGDMRELDGFAATGRGHAQHAIEFPPGGEHTVNSLLLVRAQLKRGSANQFV
jgi:hypothetical protein